MDFVKEDNTFDSFFNKLCSETAHDKAMYLSIFVDSDDKELVNMYKEAATKHNNKIMNDPHFYDAGFDLYLPKTEDACYGTGTIFFKKNLDGRINKVDFKVKCCAKMYHNGQMFSNGQNYYTPFYTYARSSMSKTPLRLANNQGIIDAGYRGNLIGMFDCLICSNVENPPFDWYMEEYTRILQICAPGLVPIYVHIVNNIEELGPSTSRGEGGIGSTGI